MTGTAMTEATEFFKVYGLDVVAIPTNRPLTRQNFADVIFRIEREKFDAILDEIKEVHADGPADPGRHDLDREVGGALRIPRAGSASRTRCSTPSTTSARPRSWPRPAARAR